MCSTPAAIVYQRKPLQKRQFEIWQGAMEHEGAAAVNCETWVSHLVQCAG